MDTFSPPTYKDWAEYIRKKVQSSRESFWNQFHTRTEASRAKITSQMEAAKAKAGTAIAGAQEKFGQIQPKIASALEAAKAGSPLVPPVPPTGAKPTFPKPGIQSPVLGIPQKLKENVSIPSIPKKNI